MTRILLDTNRLTDALRGQATTIQTIENCVEVWLPFVALAEIKAGFLLGRRAKDNERLLQALLLKPGVEVLYADRETTEVYARLFLHLRRTGKPIPANDLWIASLAIQHQLPLFSRDKHFDVLPQVPRV